MALSQTLFPQNLVPLILNEEVRIEHVRSDIEVEFSTLGVLFVDQRAG